MLSDCRLIDLPKISDPRGNLTFVQEGEHLPFGLKRIYYLYDVPAGAERGGHGHRELRQLIIPISGSFDVTLNDGQESAVFSMNRPFRGLYVAPMMWREISNFSSGSVCLVLASERYDESDYFRDFRDFLHAATNNS